MTGGGGPSSAGAAAAAVGEAHRAEWATVLAATVRTARDLDLAEEQAPAYEQTDWPQLVELYDRLLDAWPSPVVALNRAVPLSMTAAGPRAALAEAEALERDGRLSGYQSVLARGQGRPAAPPRPRRGSGRRLPAGVRPSRERG